MKDFFRRLLLLIIVGGVVLWAWQPRLFNKLISELSDFANDIIFSHETKQEFVERVLDDYSTDQITVLEDEIVPMICSQIACKFEIDFNNIMKEYKGWGGFKVWDDSDELFEAWQKHFNAFEYQSIIDMNLQTYNATLTDFYSEFCYEFETTPPTMNLPRCFWQFKPPQGKIEDYVNEERKELYWSMVDYAVDGVLILAEVASGGATTPLLVAKWAKTGYDVAKNIDELCFEESIDSNEKLLDEITESLLVATELNLKQQYRDFFDSYNKQVSRHITLANHEN